MSQRRRAALAPRDREWVEARRRHGLSHAHVEMARELGMNPKKLGSLDNHRQERWKGPLAVFIEDLYFKRFEPKAARAERLTADRGLDDSSR